MADGTYYEGEFKDGEIQGNGFKYFSANGNQYMGEFTQGELHGQGQMQYGDGSSYEGNWHRNKRQGNGVLKSADGGIYQGSFFDHKRHGHGIQIYITNDKYDGDWIQDKRQGHGRFLMSDGTIYQGQFRNDLFHGLGEMQHSSGFIYEGLWNNGKPAAMATKLVIMGVENNTIEMSQGDAFSVHIETHNDDGELIEDQNREIQISAGFRYTAPKEGSALFDLIEDVEEKPMATPFGYEIVNYPLSDQLPDDQLGLGEKSQTTLTEQTIHEDEAVEGEEIKPEQDESPEGGDTTETREPSAVGSVAGGVESPALDANTVITEQTVDTTETASTPLPPPVPNCRSEAGTVTFTDIFIPPPPPMYRPFTLLDDASSTSTTSKKSKSSRSKGSTKRDEDSKSVSSKKSVSSATDSKSIEEKYARIGEYVIVIQDVTNPPFLGMSLEPAFLLVKLKKKKKVPAPKKEKKIEPK